MKNHYCLVCQKKLEYNRKSRQSKFCSHNCSASFNNKTRILKKKRNKNSCLNCNVLVDNKYCDNKCQQAYRIKKLIDDWKEGKISGVNSNGCSKIFIKNYLRIKFDNRCVECGWNELNKHTGIVPIQVDHIDGNYLNNLESNLRLLCPNCHSLTKTYCGLNKGNGRKFRNKKNDG